MTNTFNEINIFTYNEDDLRGKIHYYLHHEFEVVSISIGIVRLHKRENQLDQRMMFGMTNEFIRMLLDGSK